MKVKVSRYTFPIKTYEKYYLYNTMSNALLEVDEELYQLINKHKSSEEHICRIYEKEMVDTLLKDKFITKNDDDEFLIYKSIINALRNEKQFLSLTIAPTMDCCFNCHYCFEKSKRPTYMSEDVMKGIAKYVGAQKNIRRFSLTWFGGEPLMAVPEMERLYRKLRRKLKDVEFYSNIITSGFHLTEFNIKALQRLRISHIQITLDGLKDTHNKIKFTEGCEDAFSKVLDNIERTCQLAPEIHIVIRTNLTKKNAHEYQELQQMILHRFAGKNIAIAPAFVLDRSDGGRIHDSTVFSTKEYPEYILNLAANGVDSPQVKNVRIYPFVTEDVPFSVWKINLIMVKTSVAHTTKVISTNSFWNTSDAKNSWRKQRIMTSD